MGDGYFCAIHHVYCGAGQAFCGINRLPAWAGAQGGARHIGSGRRERAYTDRDGTVYEEPAGLGIDDGTACQV